jgi:hypothetical protein
MVRDFERRVAAVCPAELDLARRTIARLPPDRWTLEWQLTGWLGETFRLDPAITANVAAGTILGLVSIRLQDDLEDGDLPLDDQPGARRLSAGLFDEAVAVYSRHLPPGSPFWPFLERSMIEWRTASENVLARTIRDLAARGAPLRLPAMAVCLLAGRMDRWPVVDRCLEHGLAALVRYDQLHDWEADLAAGRWNAFVASWSGRPQRPEWRERNRAAVLAGLLARGAAGEEFGRIRDQTEMAAECADQLGCLPLGTWLREYADRTARQGKEIEEQYQRAAERAVQLMFGHRLQEA